MLCKDIMNVIENTYPKHAALEWDNVGLLVGRADKEVRKIYVALDATDEVIEDAIMQGSDMLITHHPMIFSPMRQITDENFIGNRVVKLLQHDISYYAMHTNYDVLRMAELASDILGLKDAVVLGEEGIGRVGFLTRQITLRECCEIVKDKFGLGEVKVFGNLDSEVQRIAISPGSGKHMSGCAIAKSADVLVTGDIDHHEGIDAVCQGLLIVDAGHYGLEHIFIQDVVEYLEKEFSEIDVVKTAIIHPFQYV